MPVWEARFEALLRRSIPELPEDLDPDYPLRECGMDSLKIVSIIMELEDSYGTRIPDDEIQFDSFATPRSIWSLLGKDDQEISGNTA